MRRGHWWSLAGLLTCMGLMLTLTARAQVLRPAKKETLESRLVKETKVKKADVAKLLKALGPAIRAELKATGQVEITGLGTIRVVRVSEYKDLVNGLPTTIPARSYIEFVADSVTESTINQVGAVAGRTVQGYEFKVNANGTQGIKTGSTRVGRTRTR